MSRPDTITPTRYARERRQWHEAMAKLCAAVAKAREKLESKRLLDREDGEGDLIIAWNEHRSLQAWLRWLRTVNVVKYSHVSPAAGELLRRGRP